MSNHNAVMAIHRAHNTEKSYLVYFRDGENERQMTFSEADMNAILSAELGGQVIQVKITEKQVGKTKLRPESEE